MSKNAQPQRIRVQGRWYKRADIKPGSLKRTAANPQDVENSLSEFTYGLKEAFDAKMELYHSLSFIQGMLKDLNYTELVDEVVQLKSMLENYGTGLRRLQQHIADRASQDTGTNIVINW